MYAGKYIVWINGQPVEVSEAVYIAYTQGKRKMKNYIGRFVYCLKQKGI